MLVSIPLDYPFGLQFRKGEVTNPEAESCDVFGGRWRVVFEQFVSIHQ